jgi:hypothetical protein
MAKKARITKILSCMAQAFYINNVITQIQALSFAHLRDSDHHMMWFPRSIFSIGSSITYLR